MSMLCNFWIRTFSHLDLFSRSFASSNLHFNKAAWNEEHCAETCMHFGGYELSCGHFRFFGPA